LQETAKIVNIRNNILKMNNVLNNKKNIQDHVMFNGYEGDGVRAIGMD
jgi:hypothetical protein